VLVPFTGQVQMLGIPAPADDETEVPGAGSLPVVP
jgi:hypothetical protein